jgi:uncharacterized protein YndB with AHSA1/START domain
MTATTTQVYQVFIKASPEQIWEAITTPEFTSRYFYGCKVDVKLERGGPFRGLSPDRSEVWVEGHVLEADPPRLLKHTWRSLFDPEQAEEEPSRVTWEIDPRGDGMCSLTVVHDELEGAPKTAASVSQGWMLILSGLKTLLETGEPLS